MKVFVGGAAAVVLAVLTGQVIAGGLDVPDTDASVISDSDTCGDAGQQDGTDGSVPGDVGTGDSPSYEQPSEGVTGSVDGDGGDGSDGEGVVDDAAGTGDATVPPVEDVSTGPTEDDTHVITITSEPVAMPGLVEDSAATEAGALPAQDSGSERCSYVPARRVVVCD